MNLTVDRIREKLKLVIDRDDFTPLHSPIFEGNEVAYVTNCIESSFVSSVGEYVTQLESMLEDYTGVNHAIVTVNGTAALHVSLLLCDVSSDDEVLMPALTFIATANAISYIGATPHFVDVDELTLGIDSFKLDKYLDEITILVGGKCINKKSGKTIKAIVPMHTFGHPVDMDVLNSVAQKYNIQVIEDAAESLGSFYKGKHTGNHSKVAAISFNGNKIITAGGGGAILTNDEKLARKAKHITTTSKIPHKWDFNHDEIGFNYRMPAINAALCVAQLEQMEKFLKRKRILADKYFDAFNNMEGVKIFREPKYAYSNYWLNTLVLERGNENLRDEILELTNSSNIMTRPIWTLMSKLKMFKMCPKMDLSISESLERRVINIPSAAWL